MKAKVQLKTLLTNRPEVAIRDIRFEVLLSCSGGLSREGKTQSNTLSTYEHLTVKSKPVLIGARRHGHTEW